MPHTSSWPGCLSLGGEFCLVLLLTSSWLIDGLVYWPGGPRQRVLEGKKKKKPNTHQDWRPPDQLHGDNCILSLGGQVGEEGRSCHLEERGQS